MVEVLKSGFYDTIQDLGRYGYQEYGVPVSGVMDNYASRLANQILGNVKHDAVLEITMSGPILQFQCETSICLVGAMMQPKLNSKPIKHNVLIIVSTGDVLSFGKLTEGFRCYLAVANGFQTESVLNSRSMYKDVTPSYRINKGDVLPIYESNSIIASKNATIKMHTSHFTSNSLEVYKGPEFQNLSETQKKLLFSSSFTIAKENNRMAYQLVEPLKNQLKSIITSFVLPGTVQLTPSGKLIILMKDCQVTGGYPRILQLNNKSINLLSQKNTGNGLFFKLIG